LYIKKKKEYVLGYVYVPEEPKKEKRKKMMIR